MQIRVHNECKITSSKHKKLGSYLSLQRLHSESWIKHEITNQKWNKRKLRTYDTDGGCSAAQSGEMNVLSGDDVMRVVWSVLLVSNGCWRCLHMVMEVEEWCYVSWSEYSRWGWGEAMLGWRRGWMRGTNWYRGRWQTCVVFRRVSCVIMSTWEMRGDIFF